MKRIAAATALLVVLLSSVSASAAPSLQHQLLSPKEVAGWSTYYVAEAETASCPESTFAKPKTRSASREVFVNRSSETLLLEAIATSKTPKGTYNLVLQKMTKCPKTGSTVDGQVTFQRVRAVNLGHFAVPVRGFTVSFVLGGANVSGVVAYAEKGPIVLAFSEITLTALNAHAFKKLLANAISKIS
jgi:opacity protein-like surface antigen